MEEAYVSTSPLQAEFSECISISCATTWAIWNATLSFWVYIKKDHSWNLAPPPQVVHTILGYLCCDSYFYYFFFFGIESHVLIPVLSMCFWATVDCIKSSNLLAMSFLLSFLISEGDQMSDFDCWPVFNFFCLVANSLFDCLFWQVICRWATAPCCHLSLVFNVLWHQSLWRSVSKFRRQK